MNRRGCLIVAGTIAGLLLLCCIVLWFVGVPRIQDSVANVFSEELSTQVANQIDSAPGTLEPGTYTISVADLQRELDAAINTSDSSTTSDFAISVNSAGITVGFTSGTQHFGYTGRPDVENGQIVIEDMDVDNDVLAFIMPADKVAGIVENGLNNYFAARGLEVESLVLGNNNITVTTVPAGS